MFAFSVAVHTENSQNVAWINRIVDTSLFSSGFEHCVPYCDGQSPPRTRLSGWTRSSSGAARLRVLGLSVAGGRDAEALLRCPRVQGRRRRDLEGPAVLAFPVLSDIRKHFSFLLYLWMGWKWLLLSSPFCTLCKITKVLKHQLSCR